MGLKGTLKVMKTVAGQLTGEVFFEEDNLVMLLSKQHMLEFLYLPNKTSTPIQILRIGRAGTIDPDALYPKDISRTETGLYDEIMSVPVTYTVNNAVPSVTFIADIEDSSAVGQMVSEAALYTSANSMFNKKTFPGIPKTSEFGIHFEWTITLL